MNSNNTKINLFMKKSILFSAIIGTILFMTSCLGEVSNNYADTTFVYIDSDDMGTTYGKTVSLYSPARVITSSEMIMMIPGTFKIMSYSWDEQYGTKPLTVGGQSYQADFVQLTDESIDVDTKILRMSPLPEVETPLSFLEIAPPLFANSAEFMGDKWLFQYSYEVNKGLSANVEFYKRNLEDADDNIIIDIHMSHLGTADGTTKEKKTDFLALDMSSLRMEYAVKERLNIKFVYHVKDRTDPIETQSYQLILKEE